MKLQDLDASTLARFASWANRRLQEDAGFRAYVMQSTRILNIHCSNDRFAEMMAKNAPQALIRICKGDRPPIRVFSQDVNGKIRHYADIP